MMRCVWYVAVIVTLWGAVSRRSGAQLFPAWRELRRHQTSSGWSDVHSCSEIWWVDPQVVELAQLQGTC